MSDWLGMSASPRAPRPELRERVLSRARLQQGRVSWLVPMAAAAVLALALGTSWWALDQRAALSERVATLEDSLSLLRLGPRAVQIPVTVAGRAGAITIFADTVERRWLVSCYNLAPNAAGEAYQLWFVTSAGYVSASVMAMNSPEPMTMVLRAPNDSRVIGVAMSIEPRTGSRAVTGPKVFEKML